MANIDFAFGLGMANKADGYSSGGINTYFAPSTYAVDIFIGARVVKTGTSNTSLILEHKAGTLPEINVAGATGAATGVVVGIEPLTSESITYGAASTDRVLFVADDPDAIFTIQASGAVAATDIGSNASVINETAGDTATGLSAAELNSATFATTATFALKVLRVVDEVTNELGTNAVLEVKLNNHTEAANTAGI